MMNRALGVAAGIVLDRVTGEPSDALHPVAWFGSAMQRVESVLWADERRRGVAYAGVGVAFGAAAGQLLGSTPLAVTIAVAGRQLRSTGRQIGHAAAAGDLHTARDQLPSLVGRDPSQLDESGIAAAVIESLAENTVDAVVAPAFWGLVGGAPGALAYRAVNTMDAMVGRLNARYRNFGWAAARLDDAANYVPARIFALLVVAQRPTRAADLLGVVRRDASAHPSPNAGVAETAVAAMLDRELGGPLRYGDDVEDRPTLGSGPRPTPDDVERAVRIVDRAELATVGLLVLVWAADRIRSRTR